MTVAADGAVANSDRAKTRGKHRSVSPPISRWPWSRCAGTMLSIFAGDLIYVGLRSATGIIPSCLGQADGVHRHKHHC